MALTVLILRSIYDWEVKKNSQPFLTQIGIGKIKKSFYFYKIYHEFFIFIPLVIPNVRLKEEKPSVKIF